MKTERIVIAAFATLGLLASCERNITPTDIPEPDAKYVGQAVGNFSAEEWYPGGILGTTDNITAGC